MSYKDDFFLLIDENRFEEAKLLLEKNRLFANEDPFYYLHMGSLLIDLERYQEAEVYLLKGVHAFEDNGEMHFYLGGCYFQQERYEDSLHEYIQALQLGFGDGFIHGEIGNCYRALKDYRQAIFCYEDVLMDQPNNPLYLAYAASCYDAIGKSDDALQYYLKSYRLDPNDDACFDLANYYHRQQNYHEEITYLKQIKAEHNKAWKYYQLATAYNDLNEPKNALVYLLKLQENQTDDTQLHALMGDTYGLLHDIENSRKHYDIALTYYERALTLENDREWIYEEMIWIAHKEKDWHKKLSYLQRADAEGFHGVWFQHHFAICYSALHDNKKACEACEYCLTHGATEKDVLDLYAFNLAFDQREKEAIDVLLYRIEHYGEEPWPVSEIGRNYMAITKYLQAIPYLKKAISLNFDIPYHIALIGSCYYETCEYQKAYQFLYDASQKGVKEGWLFYNLAETLMHLHKKKEALAYYEKAYALHYQSEYVMHKMMILKNELYDE